jgi:glycosyltransferase involved in cell wall biosynthesis
LDKQLANRQADSRKKAAMLDVTIAICTRNRAASLRRMLDSLCALTIPPGAEWEVIVVDNGSSDGTGEVVREFAGRLPLKSFYEPMRGICRARNRAVAEAQGDYICWTDDDVIVSCGWLAAYLAAFKRHPEAGLFGGPIRPMLEAPARLLFNRGKERWPLAGSYAARTPGPLIRPLLLNDFDIPYGANLAIRSAEQRLFPFDERLGPSQSHNLLADEVDVIYRMMKAGATGWWVPDAHVEHVISQERQSLGYLIAYYRRVGETAAWLHANMPGDNINEVNGPPAFALSASPALLPRQLMKILRTIVRRTVLRRSQWLGFLAFYGYGLGILQHRRRHRGSKSKIAATTLQAESR